MRLSALVAGLFLAASLVAAQVPIPEGMHYVASTRGRVYYPVRCEAWHDLTVANLRWFATEAAAKAAKLTRSTNKECVWPKPAP